MKLTPYAAGEREILLRVQNLADKFDGVSAGSVERFDVNAWAREFYYEANAHLAPKDGRIELMLDDMHVNVTEMTLGGSIAKQAFNSTTLIDESKNDTKALPVKSLNFQQSYSFANWLTAE